MVGGDFNTIADESEKLGDLPVIQKETIDFFYCMSACSLNEIIFTESCYT